MHKYNHLHQKIRDRISDDLLFEPYKRWRPDFVDFRKKIIGEIKDAHEVVRIGQCWSHWNNREKILVGKCPDKTLFEMEDINVCDGGILKRGRGRVRGFIATILGQLKYSYVRPFGVKDGLLVVEMDEKWKDEDLNAALQFLEGHEKIKVRSKKIKEKLVFVKIRFL